MEWKSRAELVAHLAKSHGRDAREPGLMVELERYHTAAHVKASHKEVIESHKEGTPPTGVSIQVKLHLPVPQTAPQVALGVLAGALVAQQYPSRYLTGSILHIGLNEFGPDLHEVVLEVRE